MFTTETDMGTRCSDRFQIDIKFKITVCMLLCPICIQVKALGKMKHKDMHCSSWETPYSPQILSRNRNKTNLYLCQSVTLRAYASQHQYGMTAYLF